MNIWRFLEQAFTWHFPPDEYVRWGWRTLSMPLLVVIALRSGILFVAVILGSDVRLRSTKDGSALAEREFYNPSFNEVFWAPDELIVGVGDGMAIIQIPPSRMDWLRAKLP